MTLAHSVKFSGETGLRRLPSHFLILRAPQLVPQPRCVNKVDGQELCLFMETPAFFSAVFLWFLLLSVTGYSIYVGFGPPSKELRDPFEDHED